ncbi:MAG: M56 family metallopeptidase [Gemmatimonadetes bacterium]|nr:M56 family metallopeptidase [Gemmatimonadota bacterium]
MDLLIYLAEAWWPLYVVHFVEVSLFILLVWAVDRWMSLDTRLRYALYLLALAKVFVPPFYAIPLPEFLTVSDDVPIGPVYAGVVSEAEVVAPVQVAPLPLAFYLFCLWGVSVVVWAGVTLWKNAAFHRALSVAVPVDLAREMGSLDEAQDVKVYAKASLRSPLLVGIVKPRLYLPSHWSSWSSEELRGVVAHELAHRDNRDIWVLIFQAIAMALFCMNPLVWLLNRRLTFLRELRCDEAVLRETNLTPAEYGRLLFGFVDRRPALSALYFNERGTALKKRLEYVLNFKDDNVKRSRWQLAIPILIGLAIVPFSIREAYTQDEGGLEVVELVEDEKKPEPVPEQKTTPPASDDTDSSEILEYDKVELKPKLLHGVPAVYPEMARKEKLQGKVFLKFMVNVDGSVSDVKVLRTAVYADSSVSDRSVLIGPKVSMLFHHAAIGAILQFRFKPAEHNGKVVPVWMTQPITFQLLNDEFDVQEIVDEVNVQEVVKETDKYVLRIGRRVDVLEYDEVDVKAHPINIVTPVYPEEAKKEKIEGKMTLQVVVNVDGSVSDVSVLEGPEVFHQAVIDAISQSRFKPAAHNGKAVPVRMVMPIEFSLDSKEQQTTRPASGDADSSKVLEFYMVEVKPKVLHSVKLVHPEEALRDSLEGKVFLKFIVHVDGSVSNVKVLRTTGSEVFQKAAIDAISQYRYKPAEHNGKVVPVWMTQPVTFRLPKQQTTPPASVDADSSEALEFFMAEVKPKLLQSVKPVYPPRVIVFLKFMVNVDGSVGDVRVLKGPEVFHQAAIDAISQFRFEPAEHNGKPIAVWMTQPVTFRLE